MKSKNPKFDEEGYQVNIDDINGEPLPDLKRVKIMSRQAAKLPSARVVKQALSRLGHCRPGLAAVRKKTGVSQAKFARALGIKLTTYQQWEQGRRRPTGPGMALLCLVGNHPELIHELIDMPVAR